MAATKREDLEKAYRKEKDHRIRARMLTVRLVYARKMGVAETSDILMHSTRIKDSDKFSKKLLLAVEKTVRIFNRNSMHIVWGRPDRRPPRSFGGMWGIQQCKTPPKISLRASGPHLSELLPPTDSCLSCAAPLRSIWP